MDQIAHLRARMMEWLAYDPETGAFVWRKQRSNGRTPAGSVAGGFNRDGYRRIKFEGREFKAHRLAWLFVHGRWPSDEIDHINGITDDNRISNLRDVSNKRNLQNGDHGRPRSSNKCGYRGVSWDKETRKWRGRDHSQRAPGKARPLHGYRGGERRVPLRLQVIVRPEQWAST